jgi:selenide, water dikinase
MHDHLPTHDIVLVGAGHTNMHVARMWRMNPIPGTRLTIVSPFGRSTYSGMLPGTLAGLYTADDMEIDLYRFAVPSGIRLIVSEAIGIDPKRRRIQFADRPEIRYDVASIGVGSVPAGHERWRDRPEFLAIKPMATFRDRFDVRLQQLIEQRSGTDQTPINVAVVGGGAAGVEITFCVQSLLKNQSLPFELSLVDSNETVLRGYLPKTIRKAMSELAARGITLHNNQRVESIEDSQLVFKSGSTVPADIVLWATAAAPPPVFAEYDLEKSSDGFIAVRPTLQTLQYDNVFAVGDSGTIVENPVRKAGVYAVREGPILWDNIRRFLENRPAIKFEPQKGFLSLLADGRGHAFLDFMGFSIKSRWAWRLKDYIDRKFMRMYQDYRPMMRKPQSGESQIPAMHCKGCGGKAGPAVLHAALQKLKESQAAIAAFAEAECTGAQPVSNMVQDAGNATLPSTQKKQAHRALEHPEDAALLDPTASQAELISVDFFQAFTDDPWLVGRIAALNSLSDIWAMGAKPFGALAMVQLPEGEPGQQAELMFQLLSGSLHEFAKSGVELLGGHTIESGELTAGFTVLGSLDGQEPLCKSGLKPGSQLLITKPIGSGTLLAALPQAVTRAQWMDELLHWMKQSNELAARLTREVNAQAVTDVTGFGLAGHLFEMLEASGVTAEISLSQLPLFSGFVELISQGIESTLAPGNRAVESRITVAESIKATPQWPALFDPQTSGGLLLGVAENELDNTLKQFAEAGQSVFRIGQVTETTELPTLVVVE